MREVHSKEKKSPIYEFALWQEAPHRLQGQGKEQKVRAGEKELLGSVHGSAVDLTATF